MECEIKQDNAAYGNEKFCSICGMDLDINPIKRKNKSTIQLFCCDKCANEVHKNE